MLPRSSYGLLRTIANAGSRSELPVVAAVRRRATGEEVWGDTRTGKGAPYSGRVPGARSVLALSVKRGVGMCEKVFG